MSCTTRMLSTGASAVALLLGLAACGGETKGVTPYRLQIPAGFPLVTLSPANPMTVEGVALGRRLYHESKLSNDGRSCGGCHLQRYGFTKPTRAEVPVIGHANLAWSTRFLWDASKSGTLEQMMRFEVEEFFASDASKLAADPNYVELFRKAFGDGRVTTGRAADAIAQYVRTLISADSKFDRYTRREVELTQEEYLGYLIFNTEKGDCFHCHAPPLFTDNAVHNTGLEAAPAGVHAGYQRTSGRAADLGKFKTPSLRNVALRTSFMHDGRFETLEDVVDFYDHDVQRSDTVDPIMTKAGKEYGLGLTGAEKAALVAFLKTLTDERFTRDPALGNPMTP
jgi:cytochrome c peroxidase